MLKGDVDSRVLEKLLPRKNQLKVAKIPSTKMSHTMAEKYCRDYRRVETRRTCRSHFQVSREATSQALFRSLVLGVKINGRGDTWNEEAATDPRLGIRFGVSRIRSRCCC
jgi:hypothetical protein